MRQERDTRPRAMVNLKFHSPLTPESNPFGGNVCVRRRPDLTGPLAATFCRRLPRLTRPRSVAAGPVNSDDLGGDGDRAAAGGPRKRTAACGRGTARTTGRRSRARRRRTAEGARRRTNSTRRWPPSRTVNQSLACK